MTDAVDLRPLLRRLGHTFRDRSLVLAAVTHKSFANENPGVAANERLEFLGDAVLDLVIGEHVYRTMPHAEEGPLTEARKPFVNDADLAVVAQRLGLGKYLRLGRGEENQGGRENPTNLAGIVEALIGAAFVDGGYEAAKASVRALLGIALETTPPRERRRPRGRRRAPRRRRG